ncbi:hypothetical protein OG874_42205 [Nocardia sp. NBC_00565]|uniref:hypothetical protein n=1 Tax=Nocardia sp. NBC_00565 TaxID=2975993 RepID=UPI002E810E25|nr:hypothetical protein [Nocardia sp. NBC_00565]WUC03207.1 hypothetical protein OG874_42205 [Nocardia sp. NBC_00565]
MIIIIGLVVLIGAVVIGVAGVAANTGEVRTSTSDFGVFDYHFTASAGELFLYGMAIGAIGMLGLSLLLAGVWRSSRRNSVVRRELRQSRREMAAKDKAAQRPPAGAPPAAKPSVTKPSGPTATTPPSGKSVWSWNRFMRRPTGTAPVETSGRTTVKTTK